MAAPKADPARCDVFGCGIVATSCTDGKEVDSQGLGRKALANLNICDHHANWPFSEDAAKFALSSDTYKNRKS